MDIIGHIEEEFDLFNISVGDGSYDRLDVAANKAIAEGKVGADFFEDRAEYLATQALLYRGTSLQYKDLDYHFVNHKVLKGVYVIKGARP